MGTKNDPGKFDGYAAAEPDEPMFVLLGRDPMAGALVREWAYLRSLWGENSEKVSEALACADAMERCARARGKAPVAIGDKPDQRCTDVVVGVASGASSIHPVLCANWEPREPAQLLSVDFEPIVQRTKWAIEAVFLGHQLLTWGTTLPSRWLTRPGVPVRVQVGARDRRGPPLEGENLTVRIRWRPLGGELAESCAPPRQEVP